MLFRLFFERQKKNFLNNKNNFLKAAEDYALNGDIKTAQKIKSNVEDLQARVDTISDHYQKGKNCLQEFTFWHVYSFWSKYADQRDSLKPWWQQLLEFIVYVGGSVFIIKRFIFVLYIVPTGSAEPNLSIGDRICGIKYPYLFAAPKRGDLVIIDDPRFVYSKNKIVATYQKYIGFPLFGILPAGPDSWTKRVIGVGGDRVELKMDENLRPEVYVNGEKLDEPYVNPYQEILLSRGSGFLDPNNIVFKLPLLGLGLKILGVDKQKALLQHFVYDQTRPYDDQPFHNFTSKDVWRDPFSGSPNIRQPFIGDPRYDIIPEFTVPEGALFLLGDDRHNSWDCRHWKQRVVPLSCVLGRASFIFFSVDGVEKWWFMEMFKHPIDFFRKKIRWSRTFRFVHPFKELPTS